MTMSRISLLTLSILTAGALAGPAFAGASPDDRAALSYEDNVTINTACFATIKIDASAFNQCVERQIAALKAHPAPDASGVPEAVITAVTRDCAFLRRVGVAPYNDCLAQGVAAADTKLATTAAADLIEPGAAARER